MTPASFFGDGYRYEEVVELLPVTTTHVLQAVAIAVGEPDQPDTRAAQSLSAASNAHARAWPRQLIRGVLITCLHRGQLAAGQSIDDLLADYPQLEREDVLAALEFASAYTRERVIDLPVAG